jgi:lipoprotein-anchoring transpeptidase ErfK/SrfK
MTHKISAALLAVLAAAAVATGGLPVAATASTASSTATASTALAVTDPFRREVVRPGDADLDPYNIEHVYEVQYRLRWLGLFSVTPNGRFGPITKASVIRFQKRNGLPATGVVDYATWQPLIKQTVRGKGAVPSACKTSGWHACYDRYRHQVNLYSSGTLLNSWLVRGGSYSTPTRTGNFTVYYRDIDHVSHRFDDAPMPYSQFFSGGQALHGSRMMMNPFVGHSHGCVNFWTEDARQLWKLTSTRQLYVHVYGAWN